jgi:hypothetical protein
MQIGQKLRIFSDREPFVRSTKLFFFRESDRFIYNFVVGDPSGREADFRRLHLLAGQHSLARQLSNFILFCKYRRRQDHCGNYKFAQLLSKIDELI